MRPKQLRQKQQPQRSSQPLPFYLSQHSYLNPGKAHEMNYWVAWLYQPKIQSALQVLAYGYLVKQAGPLLLELFK